MREKDLYRAIDKLLPSTIEPQSMTGASLAKNGTADRYYDGPRDLWIEYKMLSATPRSGIVIGDYTALQLEWLTRRYRNGGNAVGMVGFPAKKVKGKRRETLVALQFGEHEWVHGTPVIQALTIKEAAEWIRNFCGG